MYLLKSDIYMKVVKLNEWGVSNFIVSSFLYHKVKMNWNITRGAG